MTKVEILDRSVRGLFRMKASKLQKELQIRTDGLKWTK